MGDRRAPRTPKTQEIPTKSLEAAEREPAWSTKGPQGS